MDNNEYIFLHINAILSVLFIKLSTCIVMYIHTHNLWSIVNGEHLDIALIGVSLRFSRSAGDVDHTHLFQPTPLLSLPPPLPPPLDGGVEGQVGQEHDHCLGAEVAQTVIVSGVEAVHNDGTDQEPHHEEACHDSLELGVARSCRPLR